MWCVVVGDAREREFLECATGSKATTRGEEKQQEREKKKN